ncbi:DUF3422 domain-containing protein [Rhizorhabdus histidinilytica]|uniref:Uncharacterized membrane-anchored protein n=1 Tax=Rhizorhabdus histidinilytica TaxID=439228 RepID=A0A1T5GVS3_9SPHN|nr:DUF3422 domain-containing protein [Rhizorhabdus histidinilytica]SKC12523.1 Uncharacterized membrane-anchored protein [Rhizorhabdus histidinilytica]
MTATEAPAFREHPLRRQVVGEMHLRRFPAFTLPARIFQLFRLVPADEREVEQAALDRGPCPGAPDDRHRETRWSPEVRASWERHSEASTVTVTLTGPELGAPVWGRPEEEAAAAALDWAERLPGGVIRASRLLIVADEDAAAPAVAEAGFRASHLVSCHIAGAARLWSDFRIHGDGYGRLVVAANGLPVADLIRAVQRLQELGNYRNLALLGLPAAQQAWGEVDRIERALAASGRSLRARDRRDDELLADLTQHAEDLLSIAAACDYRMKATRAYAQIVSDRLQELHADMIPGFQSLDDFTARRFHPAVRTCVALTDRIALLDARAAQLTALLRTRIETNIENQNGRLLASMDRSARLQLRLQHLVEGLSAVAISYYLLGLLAYPLKAAEKWRPGLSATTLLGLSAPLILLGAAVLLGRMRHRLVAADDKAAPDDA